MSAQAPTAGSLPRAVRFVSSALRMFAEEFSDHARRGPCGRCRGAAVLPTPAQPAYLAAA